MAKNYSKKRALKYAAVALACLTSFSIAGCSACNTEDPDDDKKTSKALYNEIEGKFFQTIDCGHTYGRGKRSVRRRGRYGCRTYFKGDARL